MELKSGLTVEEHLGLYEYEDGSFDVTYGCDGGVWRTKWHNSDYTPDDLREIADAEIARWTRFRASIPT
jgi:hypothetical protein